MRPGSLIGGGNAKNYLFCVTLKNLMPSFFAKSEKASKMICTKFMGTGTFRGMNIFLQVQMFRVRSNFRLRVL